MKYEACSWPPSSRSVEVRSVAVGTADEMTVGRQNVGLGATESLGDHRHRYAVHQHLARRAMPKIVQPKSRYCRSPSHETATPGSSATLPRDPRTQTNPG
jgi:hypothetical protein